MGLQKNSAFRLDLVLAAIMVVAGLAFAGLGWLQSSARKEVAQARVSAVACHPKDEILVAGYSDGTILLVRIQDGAEILVRRNGGAPVVALAWNARGTLLAFATDDGDAGFLPL
jgi:WD40 repeat protein